MLKHVNLNVRVLTKGEMDFNTMRVDPDTMVSFVLEYKIVDPSTAERYARMSINYENEQRELVKRVDEDEKRLGALCPHPLAPGGCSVAQSALGAVSGKTEKRKRGYPI